MSDCLLRGETHPEVCRAVGALARALDAVGGLHSPLHRRGHARDQRPAEGGLAVQGSTERVFEAVHPQARGAEAAGAAGGGCCCARREAKQREQS